ncbi:energy transducer TonB [Undibacterium sp. Di26W]|uniref:energy transducer TonB n=1 Tax=Undibacterium sp. Di26W TaxID=3413035 RepID=UPI003BF435F2
MEFTENKQNPFKRMSRLGVVTLLHVALLAVILNDMKIKISLPSAPPIILKDITEPKVKEPEQPKFDRELPKPKDPPPYFPEVETKVKPTTDESGIAKKTGDAKEGKGKTESGGAEGGTGTSTEPPAVIKAPHHVAAVVDMNACTKPVYPASSIRNEETGTVTFSMLIGSDGRVLETKTDTSSGFRTLDRAAAQALSICRFKPGTVDGVPQQSWTKVQYVWKIDG